MPIKCPKCHALLEVRLSVGDSYDDEPVDVNEVRELIESIIPEALDIGFEQEFFKKQKDRWEQYGERIRMSAKQMAVLRKLAAK